MMVRKGIIYKKQKNTSREETFSNNYSTYAATLRSWLVAYGIGAPVLFLTNEYVSSKITLSNNGEKIITYFLAGVVLQVILALINKWISWNIYAGELNQEYKKTIRYKICACINNQVWIDILIDLISITLFIFATYFTLKVFI